MKVLNELIKNILLVLIHMYSAVVLYIVAFAVTSPLIATVLSIVSAITKTLPEFAVSRFWFVCLVSAVPVWLLLYAVTIVKILKNNKKNK